ncbi:MAG TPA: ribosome small subunit-dependent GTPase A [Ohtaekwangia sp.]|nr:ribosome small subunit-dependent GTPase A [Ohtaekwangia sp.]
MTGLVLRSTGSFYEVLAEGRLYTCRVRGKIRLEGIRETNPVAVGDHVLFDLEKDEGAIREILPRKNHILRQSIKKTGHSQVLAANIDQAILVATLALPRTSTGFIDRFLVSAEAFRIPQILIFNKKDLFTADDQEQVERLTELYERIGVRCLTLSARAGDVSLFRDALQHKITLVAGHSGVGKSTLLNNVSPSINQSTAGISEFSQKGTHTTTFAEMFRLNEDTFVIDTPGVKEWGLVDMNEQELSDYFPEMRERRLECKFGARCLHIHEPKCAVLDAVQQGHIAKSRYGNYVSMLTGHDNRK